MTTRSNLIRAAIYGSLGGVAATGCMSALRAVAVRSGLIQVTVPQATLEWAGEQTGAKPRDPAVRAIAAELIHLILGAALGLIYGVALGKSRKNVHRGGLAFG